MVSVHVAVVPRIGALLASIGPDLATVLAILIAVGAAILPAFDALGTGGAGGSDAGYHEHRGHGQGEAFHGLGFEVDDCSTIGPLKKPIQAPADTTLV